MITNNDLYHLAGYMAEDAAEGPEKQTLEEIKALAATLPDVSLELEED